MLMTLAESSPDPGKNRTDEMENCIKAIAGGDREALGRLYEDTYAAVFGFALSILKNRQDAEDVLQEVYVRIWQSAASYREWGKPMAWIFTITRNLALMDLRRKNRTVPVAPQDWPEMFSDVQEVTAEDSLVLSSLMERLGDDEREIVLLHTVAGLKHSECAQLLGMGLSTVLSKYSRAIKKLRQAMEENEYDE